VLLSDFLNFHFGRFGTSASQACSWKLAILQDQIPIIERMGSGKKGIERRIVAVKPALVWTGLLLLQHGTWCAQRFIADATPLIAHDRCGGSCDLRHFEQMLDNCRIGVRTPSRKSLSTFRGASTKKCLILRFQAAICILRSLSMKKPKQ
jgi:hypothetical protein